MSLERLSIVMRPQGNNRDLLSGEVAPRDCALGFEDVPVLVHAFRRMVRELRYDVCEMAFTTFLCAKAHGKPFTALPIFLVRGFHHGAVLQHRTSGIRHPRDLHGRRVGVNRGYTVTTGVWARGILQREYGVDLEEITWLRSDEEHVAEYRPPANVIGPESGPDLAEQLASGKLPAVVGALKTGHPDVAPLLPDAEEAAFRSLETSGLYPINHLVVVRDDVLAQRPGLAVDLFDAFAEAKLRYVERLQRDAIDEPTATDRMYRRVMQVTGRDPLPYGIGPNRPMIDELMGHAVAQRILERPLDITQLFAAETLQRTA